MDWTRKALYKLATGPAYWPPIDTVKLTFSSLYERHAVARDLIELLRTIGELLGRRFT